MLSSLDFVLLFSLFVVRILVCFQVESVILLSGCFSILCVTTLIYERLVLGNQLLFCLASKDFVWQIYLFVLYGFLLYFVFYELGQMHDFYI